MAVNFLLYKRINKNQYKVLNWLAEEEYTIDAPLVVLLKNLDGKTSPYDIDCHMSRSEINDALDMFEESELLRDSMTLMKGFGSYYRTVFIPKWPKAKRVISSFSNLLLMLLFIPAIVTGLCLARGMEIEYSFRAVTGGQLLGIVVGIFLHEWSHAAACIAYGGKVFEFGVMINNFLPGAYTLMSTSTIKRRFHLAQIDAAGIEANALLAGVFFILALKIPLMRTALYYAGLQNAVIAMVNLVFFEGLDGMNIIADIIGVDDLKTKVKAIIKRRALRKKISSVGIDGKIAVVSSYIIYLQPLLIISAIIWFVTLYF